MPLGPPPTPPPMPYIDYSELTHAIKQNRLDQIVDLTPSAADLAIGRAEELVYGYLSARYDIEAIRDQATGPNSRSKVLTGIMIDITLYYMHRQHNPKSMPEFRQTAYDEAIGWLEGVQAMTINPELPKLDTNEKDYVRFGSNTRRENHI